MPQPFPAQVRGGFILPRFDARLRDGDEINLYSSSQETWVVGADLLSQGDDEADALVFTVERLGDASVALLCEENGLYVSFQDGAASCASSTPVSIGYTRSAINGDGEVNWNANYGTFTTPDGYLRSEKVADNVALQTDGPDDSGWQRFTVQLVASVEAVRPLARGVNLGNWLLLEKWMDESLFYDEAGDEVEDYCQVGDEQGLMAYLGEDVATARMEAHWATYITEDDIEWIVRRGLNAVRVPFGFWLTHPEPPFFAGQFKYIEKLFDWCAAHGVGVLLDFHGLKGSQQGSQTSGNCGGCQDETCEAAGYETTVDWLEEANVAVNLDVIRNLSMTFGQNPSYLGFEIANEVAGASDSRVAFDFYQQAYETIMAHAKSDSIVVAYATWTRVFQRPSIPREESARASTMNVHHFVTHCEGPPRPSWTETFLPWH